MRIHAVLVHLRRLRRSHLQAIATAVVATALTAGLALAGAPPEAAGPGLEKAASHSGKVVPVQAGQVDVSVEDETGETDEDTAEDQDTEVETADGTGGDNCATDPTGLSDEELAAMRHGSIVCWAAHQDSWPEEFKNHGQWVKSWAHWKAPDGAAAAASGKNKAKDKSENP